MKGWKQVPIIDTCDLFTDGNWIEKKDQSTSGIRLVQTGNVGTGFFKDRREKARWITEETFEQLKCQEIFPGDYLVSRLPDPVGRGCLIPETGDKMITAVDCSILRFKNLAIDANFFNYYSQSRTYLADVEAKCTGATRKRISRKNLGTITIPLPPLPEQKRIVAILDKAFAAISQAVANAEENLANARELFESYLSNVFARKGDEWEEKPLGQICENLDSKRIPITKAKRESGDIPYYGASGIVDYVADYIFNEELLLVSEDGANLLARTYPIAFSITGKTWVNNHAHVLRFENKETLQFVEYYFNSISLEPYVSGMAQPKLNQKALNSIPVPLPDLLEQKRVVKIFNALAKEIQHLETIYQQKLTALAELKQSILQKAFSGELTTDASSIMEDTVA